MARIGVTARVEGRVVRVGGPALLERRQRPGVLHDAGAEAVRDGRQLHPVRAAAVVGVQRPDLGEDPLALAGVEAEDPRVGGGDPAERVGVDGLPVTEGAVVDEAELLRGHQLLRHLDGRRAVFAQCSTDVAEILGKELGPEAGPWPRDRGVEGFEVSISHAVYSTCSRYCRIWV